MFERACSADAVLAELWRRRCERDNVAGMAPTNVGLGREAPPGMGANGGLGGGLCGGNGHPMSGGHTSAQSIGILPAWTSVTVHGLKGAAHHNGKVSQIESYDKESGRYAVRLPSGEGVMIKFANLLQRVEVECVGLEAHMNGMLGLITSYDPATDLYQADIRGKGRHALKLNNMILPAGARGRVVGLTSPAGAKWNEQIGQVVSFDGQAGRYVVQMSKDDQLRIKAVNFRI